MICMAAGEFLKQKMKKGVNCMRKIVYLLSILLMVTLFSGVIFSKGGTIVVGIHDDTLTLDPQNFRHRETETILRNMYDGLVTRTSDMVVVPELAQELTQLDDFTWEITIKEGVTFHDGTPFTVFDAVYTINRIVREGAMGGTTSPRKGLLGTVLGAGAVDETTLHVYLSAPMPHFLAMLPFHMVVPRSLGDEMVDRPIGTGPFTFVEWERGSHLVMERFQDYYGGSLEIPPVGPAPADRVIFRVIPEPTSRLAALRAGEVQIITMVPFDYYPILEEDPNVEPIAATGTRSFFIDLNVNEAPFDHVLVRQALNYAVDRDALIEQILDGMGTKIPTILSPQALGYLDWDPYPYDPGKARELLAEAGYGSQNPLSFTLDVGSDDRTEAMAIAHLLGQVGIQVQVEVWPDYGTLRDLYIREDSRRQAWFGSWGNASLDPEGIIPAKFYTNIVGVKEGDGRGNFSGYSNPKVDELIHLTKSTFDPEERVSAFQEIQEILYSEVPQVFLYVPQELYGVSKDLQNWVPSPDSRINLHRAYSK